MMILKLLGDFARQTEQQIQIIFPKTEAHFSPLREESIRLDDLDAKIGGDINRDPIRLRKPTKKNKRRKSNPARSDSAR
jgi:hypothetical protein